MERQRIEVHDQKVPIEKEIDIGSQRGGNADTDVGRPK